MQIDHTTQTAIAEILPLSENDRLDAKEQARQLVIRSHGDKPTQEQFIADIVTEYPAWLNRAVFALLVIVGLSAFATSFFRLFSIGRDNFLMTINDHNQGVIVGVAVVLMAEFLTMVSGLSREVLLPHGRRWLMFFPMILGVVIALVGNWTVAQPHDLFSVLEAVSPPIVVLIVSMLGERLIVSTIKARHELRVMYERALNDWKTATANPEGAPQWRNIYASALRERLIAINSKGTGSTRRKEIMQGFNNRTWSILVSRELQSDDWFNPDAVPVPVAQNAQQALPEATPVNPTLPSPMTTINHNGHRVTATNGNGNGRH